MITTNTVQSLLVPGLLDVAFDAYTMVETVGDMFYKKRSTERAYEEWTEIAGIGPATVKPEGLGISYQDIQVLNTKRVTQTIFGTGIRCTMEAKKFELYGKLEQLATALGKAFPIRKEVDMLNIINMGFTAVLATGFDGTYLFSASHPIKSPVWTGVDAGGAYPDSASITVEPGKKGTLVGSNLLTAADLSYTSLQDMITLMRRTVDEQGNYIIMTPKYLWCAVENEWVARKLLAGGDEPDTTDRNVNTVTSAYTLKPVISPYFFDTDAWGLFAGSDSADLRFFQSIPFTTDSEDDFDTGDTKIKGIEGWGLGFGSWRGITASRGA